MSFLSRCDGEVLGLARAHHVGLVQGFRPQKGLSAGCRGRGRWGIHAEL